MLTGRESTSQPDTVTLFYRHLEEGDSDLARILNVVAYIFDADDRHAAEMQVLALLKELDAGDEEA